MGKVSLLCPFLLTVCSLNFYLIIALNRLRRSELNVGCAVGMDKIIRKQSCVS